jgi:hypothetical protein
LICGSAGPLPVGWNRRLCFPELSFQAKLNPFIFLRSGTVDEMERSGACRNFSRALFAVFDGELRQSGFEQLT